MSDIISVNAKIVVDENNSYRLVDSNGNQEGVAVFNNGDITVYDKDNNHTNYTGNIDAFLNYINDNDLHFMSMTTGNHRWKKYNPNPEQKNTGDCSIRSYCGAFGLTWDAAYDIASKIAKSMSELPDSSHVCDAIITQHFGMHVMEEEVKNEHHEDLVDNEENAKKKQKKSKKKKVAKMTINEFAMTHPFGTYIVVSPHHQTAVINGEYWDSWDSGEKKISKVYTK